MIYNFKISAAKMLTNMLLTHSFKAFYPTDATCNGSFSILKESRVQNVWFFPLRSTQLVF